MSLAHWAPQLALRLRRPFQILSWLVLILFIVATTIANGRYLLTFLADIIPLVVLHNAAALALGWLAARAIRMNTPDTRAVTIEIGMQNSGLGLALILNQFDALGGAALIAAGWGIWHIVSGVLLATLWKRSDARGAAP
jgi:BASS family bile acid:Na+ symporter